MTFLEKARQLWTVIKNEKNKDNNTADRVGSAGHAIMDVIEHQVGEALEGKVDKVDGKQLSTNDLTDAIVQQIDGNTDNIAVNVQEIDSIKQDLANKEHFSGYYQTNAEIQALPNPSNGDYAYSAESGTKWTYSDGYWINTGVAVPDQMVPKTETLPKVNGVASVGNENKFAAGDHVHPTDNSRASSAETLTALNTKVTNGYNGAVDINAVDNDFAIQNTWASVKSDGSRLEMNSGGGSVVVDGEVSIASNDGSEIDIRDNIDINTGGSAFLNGKEIATIEEMSTVEQFTGRYWINGQPIYSRSYYINLTLPTTSGNMSITLVSPLIGTTSRAIYFAVDTEKTSLYLTGTGGYSAFYNGSPGINQNKSSYVGGGDFQFQFALLKSSSNTAQFNMSYLGTAPTASMSLIGYVTFLYTKAG